MLLIEKTPKEFLQLMIPYILFAKCCLACAKYCILNIACIKFYTHFRGGGKIFRFVVIWGGGSGICDKV